MNLRPSREQAKEAMEALVMLGAFFVALIAVIVIVGYIWHLYPIATTIILFGRMIWFLLWGAFVPPRD